MMAEPDAIPTGASSDVFLAQNPSGCHRSHRAPLPPCCADSRADTAGP